MLHVNWIGMPLSSQWVKKTHMLQKEALFRRKWQSTVNLYKEYLILRRNKNKPCTAKLIRKKTSKKSQLLQTHNQPKQPHPKKHDNQTQHLTICALGPTLWPPNL